MENEWKMNPDFWDSKGAVIEVRDYIHVWNLDILV